MKNLLKLEFRRLKRQKSFYICLAIMLALLLIAGVTTKILINYMPEIIEINEEFEGVPNANTVAVDTSAFILNFVSTGMFSILTAIFVSITVCDDYDNRIVKNIIARGYSRTSHYFSKLIYVFSATTIMFIVAGAVATGLGGAFFGFGGLEGKAFLLIGGQYIVCMAGVVLSFAIASVVKRLGGSIAANIIVPIIIPILLSLADTAINAKNFKIANAWISSFLESFKSLEIASGRIVACVLGSVAYGAAFILAGYFANRKSEL